MYITANLPPLYGRFNQIRRDNYPFRNLFGTYLEAIARLGLSLQMDADLLVGVIEDALLGDMRLPDIPEGDEPVKFRFTLENETIQEYFGKSSLTNKAIIMLVIRMTIRLTEQFGTSLSRLICLLSEISGEDLQPRREPKPKKPTVRVAKKPVKRPETAPEASVPAPKPAKGPMPQEPVQAPNAESILNRLEALTKRGDALVGEPAGTQAEEPEVVVATNPLLGDFLGF